MVDFQAIAGNKNAVLTNITTQYYQSAPILKPPPTTVIYELEYILLLPDDHKPDLNWVNTRMDLFIQAEIVISNLQAYKEIRAITSHELLIRTKYHGTEASLQVILEM